MLNGESSERKGSALKQHTRLHLVQFDAYVGNLPRPEDDFHQRLHARKGKRPAVYIQFLHRLPTTKGARQPPQSKDVIKVAVRQKDLIEFAETQPP